MKRIALLLFLAACQSSSYELTEAERNSMREQIDTRLGDLADTLALTPDQRAAAEPIVADSVRRMKEAIDRMREVGRRRTTTRELRRVLEQIRGEMRDRLAPILTEEQVRRLDAELAALADALRNPSV